VYVNGASADDAQSRWLWDVLAAGTPADRVAFLRFVSGRTRLPSSGALSPPLTIHRLGSDAPDRSVPKSQTCFVEFSLPAYSSIDVLRARLLFAIHETVSMDGDQAQTEAVGWEGV
jgi:hypothetical protein